MKNLLEALRLLGFNTTIHGCRHLVEDGRHWIERLIWVVVLGAALAGVIQSCLDVYSDYMSTPSVTFLESTQYPAWNVPFPAVGICDVNKISKSKAELFARELYELNDKKYSVSEIFDFLQYLGHMYDEIMPEGLDFKVFEEILSKSNTTIDLILKRLSPTCEDILVRCRWKGRTRSCRELFISKATVNGICCVFNTLPDYDESEVESPVAEALQATGYRTGLSVIIDPQAFDYFFPVMPTYGVQLMFFSPMNRPENSNGMIEYVAGCGFELFFSVDVFSTFSTGALSYFTPEERGCYYPKEKNPRYTSTNCLTACMRDLVLETCHCLPYYMRNSTSSKLCHLGDIGCLNKAKAIFQQYLKDDAGADTDESGKPNGPPSPCSHCLPSCSNTWYEVQSSYAKIEAYNSNVQTLDGLEISENLTSLHIYYSTLDTTLYKQDIIYTRTELVSNLGGICSLFSGFSFLSLLEIIYFLTIRLFYITRQGDSQNNETSQERVNAAGSDTLTVADLEPSPYWHEIAGKSNQRSHWTTHNHF